MQFDNRLLSFLGKQIIHILFVVLEEIFREHRRTFGVLQNIQMAFLVRIAIGIVLTQFEAFPFGCIIQAGCQLVRFCLSDTGPRFPAAGTHPLRSTSCSIAVDRNKDGFTGLVLVNTLAPLGQRNINLFSHDALGVETTLAELMHYTISYLTGIGILKKPTVR